jgi:hypothetical protein
MLTGKVLNDDEPGVAGTLRGMIKRLGEPVIRAAVGQAMLCSSPDFRDSGGPGVRGRRRPGRVRDPPLDRVPVLQLADDGHPQA